MLDGSRRGPRRCSRPRSPTSWQRARQPPLPPRLSSAVVEADGTRMAIAMARDADAPVYLVHLSSQAALAEIKAGRAPGGRRLRGDVPALPGARRVALRAAGRGVRAVCHLAAAALPGRPRRPVGRPGGRSLDIVSTDHVPDRLAVQADGAESRSTGSATARRASRRCSRSSTARASRAGASPSSAWSTCCRPPRRASSA